MEPFARIPLVSDDHEDSAQLAAVDEAVGRRRRSTRNANLGTFTGYRIGLDIGNGNIGWCILFEDGRRLHFLTAEDIAAHNKRALPRSGRRTQLPCLARFVPAGVHKFDARETDQRGGQKSYSKIRAEARAGRRMLDARQQRRLHVARALREAGLLPCEGETLEGHIDIKADVLRAKLLDPSFPAHPHDLGRALKNALKRRGYLKPIGRSGPDEGSGFAKRSEGASTAKRSIDTTVERSANFWSVAPEMLGAMGFRSESVTVPSRGRRKTGEGCRLTATMPQATKRSSPCLQPIP